MLHLQENKTYNKKRLDKILKDKDEHYACHFTFLMLRLLSHGIKNYFGQHHKHYATCQRPEVVALSINTCTETCIPLRS